MASDWGLAGTGSCPITGIVNTSERSIAKFFIVTETYAVDKDVIRPKDIDKIYITKKSKHINGEDHLKEVCPDVIETLYNDIDLILNHLEIDQSIFRKVLWTAFEERKTPLKAYERVLHQIFGRSKGSHRSWKVFLKRNNYSQVKENQIEIIERHRKFLDQFFIK